MSASEADRASDDIERVFAKLGDNPNSGLVAMPDVFTATHQTVDTIIALAARYRIPTIYPYRFMVEPGGLICYGVDNADLYRRAADYVDRILKGAKPADLPVQLPTKFEMVINLKTAKALGLSIPDKLLATADDVIE
jgi:putative ABC transport system substrate-binding protein